MSALVYLPTLSFFRVAPPLCLHDALRRGFLFPCGALLRVGERVGARRSLEGAVLSTRGLVECRRSYQARIEGTPPSDVQLLNVRPMTVRHFQFSESPSKGSKWWDLRALRRADRTRQELRSPSGVAPSGICFRLSWTRAETLPQNPPFAGASCRGWWSKRARSPCR